MIFINDVSVHLWTCYPQGQMVLLSHKSNISLPCLKLSGSLLPGAVQAPPRSVLSSPSPCNGVSSAIGPLRCLLLRPRSSWSSYVRVPADRHMAPFTSEPVLVGFRRSFPLDLQNLLIKVVYLVYIIFELSWLKPIALYSVSERVRSRAVFQNVYFEWIICSCQLRGSAPGSVACSFTHVLLSGTALFPLLHTSTDMCV